MIAPATNCITGAEDKLISMLVNSVAFQVFVGEVTPAAAAARVYVDALPEPTFGNEYEITEWSSKFPLCILQQPQQGNQITINRYSHGVNWEYRPDYILNLAFLRFRNHDVTQQEDIRALRNEIGDVIEDLTDLSGGDNTFAFTSCYPTGATFQAEETYTQMANLGQIIGWEWEFEKVTQ